MAGRGARSLPLLPGPSSVEVVGEVSVHGLKFSVIQGSHDLARPFENLLTRLLVPPFPVLHDQPHAVVVPPAFDVSVDKIPVE